MWRKDTPGCTSLTLLVEYSSPNKCLVLRYKIKNSLFIIRRKGKWAGSENNLISRLVEELMGEKHRQMIFQHCFFSWMSITQVFICDNSLMCIFMFGVFSDVIDFNKSS